MMNKLIQNIYQLVGDLEDEVGSLQLENQFLKEKVARLESESSHVAPHAAPKSSRKRKRSAVIESGMNNEGNQYFKREDGSFFYENSAPNTTRPFFYDSQQTTIIEDSSPNRHRN